MTTKRAEKMLTLCGSLLDLARTAQFFPKSAQHAASATSQLRASIRTNPGQRPITSRRFLANFTLQFPDKNGERWETSVPNPKIFPQTISPGDCNRGRPKHQYNTSWVATGNGFPPRQKLERSQKGPNEKNINHIKHGDRVSCPC